MLKSYFPKQLSRLLVVIGCLLFLIVLTTLQSRTSQIAGQGTGAALDQGQPSSLASAGRGPQQISAAPSSAEQAKVGLSGPVVGRDLKHDVSPALSSIQPIQPSRSTGPLADRDELERSIPARPFVQDPVIQLPFRPGDAIAAMPNPSRNFEGVYNYWGYYPPDTNGDVGPNHYVQMVNVGFQVFDKRGNSLYGPADTNTIWRGFGGVCETSNDGDPIVLYDPISDRWMLSQFGVPGGANGYHQCMAVSTSADPTGSYYRYDFLISQTIFNDYPHYGVWPDGYYAAFDMFRGNTFIGSEPVVFNRAAMIAGQPATFQAFPPDRSNHSMLPADLDGMLLPPAGEPNTYATLDLNGQAELRFFNFHTDWANPANSTFTPSGSVAVAPFNLPCSAQYGAPHACIPQPGTSVVLDGLADRLMNRLAYRNFGDHQTLVTNHTVDAANGQKDVNAAVRWYEFRSPPGATFVPSLYQQGTYAPDADSRWMGSVAMDRMGNLAVGYSVSGPTTYPSIRYAGRFAGDPLGVLTQGEASLIAGAGSQTGAAARWGDYSMMAVDPANDCTFWYTQEYYSVTGERNWRTRIGSFKFPGCTAPTPTPTATGTPPTRTPTHTRTPLPSPTATSCPGGATYVGSIITSDPVVAGRLNRDGIPSSCAAPKACPGPADGVLRHYDSYTYTNTSTNSKCVSVTINENCGNNALLSAAYLTVFDPNNLCANYLADMGVAGPLFGYSFTLGPNSSAVVVVEENAADVGCASYTLRINPCSTQP